MDYVKVTLVVFTVYQQSRKNAMSANVKTTHTSISTYADVNYFFSDDNLNKTVHLYQFADFYYPTSTRRHGNFAGVHTLLRIILSSNSAVLINIITGVSPPHFDFFVFYVLCQC
jgi:hypothetical protein